jgi:muconolactone delta-isomerase
MQFMTLFSWHPDKAETPAPADLREAEFEMIRGLHAAGLVRQIWLRGDAGGACAIVEAASTDEVAEKFNALPLVREGYLQPPMIVPLKPSAGVRKPPRKETASRKGVAAAATYGDLRVARFSCRAVGMTIKNDFEG